MAADDERSKEKDGPGAAPGRTPFLPPLDFSSIVILLYFPTLIQLGLMEDPGTGQLGEDLVLAKRNIDLLDLLRDRTKGNLEEEEEKFLEGVLNQLKMAYLKKADLLKM
ncbi:MAG: DUF1844 domain-containing protein [Candidatus Aminicenantales bacterium]